MRIYIQSKSGNYNTVIDMTEPLLGACFIKLREKGGYAMKRKIRASDYKELENIIVPFEEIEFIREARESDE